MHHTTFAFRLAFLGVLALGCGKADEESRPAAAGGAGGGGGTGGAGAASVGGNGGAGGAETDGGGSPVASIRLRVTLTNVSTPDALTTSTGSEVPVMFSAGVFIVHSGEPPWFEPGSAASPGLERLAEDGAIDEALAELEARPGLADFFGADDLGVSYDDSPIGPGDAARFIIDARPGDRLEFGMMWVQSNDIFVATYPGGIALFDGGSPRLGDVTSELTLWDAGTEENQEPGLGDAQAPRQPEPGYGTPEDGVITELLDGVDAMGFTYPPLDDTLEVMITAE
jgi:hypothetical protein